MTKFKADLRPISAADLGLVVGGSAAPKKNFMPTEGQKLTGAALSGGLAGVVAGAKGGPGGMLIGGLIGASVGVGGHVVNSYTSGGNRNNIPPTPTTPSCYSCHGGKK